MEHPVACVLESPEHFKRFTIICPHSLLQLHHNDDSSFPQYLIMSTLNSLLKGIYKFMACFALLTPSFFVAFSRDILKATSVHLVPYFHLIFFSEGTAHKFL